MKVRQKIKQRPAESAQGAAGVLAGALVLALHLPPRWAGPLTMAVSGIAGGVTYVVNHGGLAGVLARILHGDGG